MDTPATFLTLTLEQWLAALLICVYAWFRYATPQGVRADTTWGKFFVGRVAYLAIALAVFAVIAYSPLLLKSLLPSSVLSALVGDSAAHSGGSSTWLVSALMLVILLSETPVLTRIDHAIRSYFHRVASIPKERRHWIELLSEAQIRDPEEGLERLAARYQQSEGALRPEDASFTRDSSVRYLWTRTTILLDRLEQLAPDRRYSGYLRSPEFAALKDRYHRIETNAVACLDLQRSNPQDRAVVILGREVLQQVRGLLADLYSMAAGLVLSCGRTEAQRRLCAEGLGLILSATPPKRPVDIHAVLWLLILLLAVAGASLTNLLAWQVVMVAVIYFGAALSAVLVREGRNSYFPDRRVPDVAPIGYYLLAGITGMVLAWVTSVTFRVLFATPQKGGDDPLGYLLGGSWAWGLGAFTVATGIAVLTDDWLDARLPALHRRFDVKGRLNLVDGAALALVVGTVALLAICPIALPDQEGRWIQVALRTGGLGLLIGTLVPTWVRAASAQPREEAGIRQSVKPAAAES